MVPILQGIRIVDLTAVILGPYGAQILGDLGAEIIKIEPPEGDSMRPIAPTAAPGLSAIFANVNRNKKSVVLDLKTAAGKEALAELLKSADVLIHNMRQEALDKLGFGFTAARSHNPRLIYCAAVGFGGDGPYAGRPAYDDVIQAASGFAGLFAARDGTPLYAPSIIADKVTGLHLVYAVLAALLHRERSGEVPGYVEIPMFEALTAFNLVEHLSGATWEKNGATGYQRMLARDRKPHKTKDGWLGALPYTATHWRKLFAELGRSDIAEEPWFRDDTERSKNFARLYAILSEAMASRSTAECIDMFQRLDLPFAIVNSSSDLLVDPHLQAVDFFAPNFNRETPVLRTMRQAVTFGDLAIQPDIPPPLLGADTDAVLEEIAAAKARRAKR